MHHLDNPVFVKSTLDSATAMPMQGVRGEPPLRDVALTHPAYPAVERLILQGIVTRFEDGTFRGVQKVSTGQYAMTLLRTAQQIQRLLNATPARKTGPPQPPRNEP